MPLGDLVVRNAPMGAFFRTGDSRSLTNPVLNTFGVTDSHTIAAWVRVNSAPADGTTEDIVRLYPAANDNDILTLGVTTSGTFTTFVYTVSDAAGAVIKTKTFPGHRGTEAESIKLNTWYHVLGCKNGTFSIRMFVNGIDSEGPDAVGIPVTSDAPRAISVGIDGRTSTGQFDGDIWDIKLWSIAVDEGSVLSAYNGGCKDFDPRQEQPCYDAAAFLQHWWRFGQPNGDAGSSNPEGNEFMSDWRRTSPPPVGVGIPIITEGGDVDDEDILSPIGGPAGAVADFVFPPGGTPPDDGAVLGPSLGGEGTNTIGLALEEDSWTVAFWALSRDEKLTMTAVDLKESDASLANLIRIGQNSSDGADPGNLSGAIPKRNGVLEVRLRHRLGNVTADEKLYWWDDFFPVDTWIHTVVTWDGTAGGKGVLRAYRNGVEVDVDTKDRDSDIDKVGKPAPFHDNGDRKVFLGNVRNASRDPDSPFTEFSGERRPWDGNISHVVVFDGVLPSNAIRQMYAQGICFDVRYNFGDYQQADSMKHSYKPGENQLLSGGPGLDFISKLIDDDGATDFFGNPRPPAEQFISGVDNLSEGGVGQAAFDDERPLYTGGAAGSGVETPLEDSIPPPPVLGAFASVDLNGVDEYFLNSTNNLIGIANTWSISIWVNRQVGISSRHLVQIETFGVPGNTIFWGADGADSMNLSLSDSAGTIFKAFSYPPGVTPLDQWHNLVLTWDGTDAIVYNNGAVVTPDFITTDIPGVMTDTARSIRYGAFRDALLLPFPGYVGHMGIWNVALTKPEALEITLGGHAIDLRVDQGSYASSANLRHYWRPGFVDVGFTDEQGTPTAINYVNSANLDSSDIILDAP